MVSRPTVNQEISVVVRSYEPIKYFMYQVVGRGDIILSRNVDVSVKLSLEKCVVLFKNKLLV